MERERERKKRRKKKGWGSFREEAKKKKSSNTAKLRITRVRLAFISQPHHTCTPFVDVDVVLGLMIRLMMLVEEVVLVVVVLAYVVFL